MTWMADNLRIASALSLMLSVTTLGNTTALPSRLSTEKTSDTEKVLGETLLHLLAQGSYCKE